MNLESPKVPFEEVVGGGAFLFVVAIFVADPHCVQVAVRRD